MEDFDPYELNHRVPNTPENRLWGHHLISDQITKDELAVVLRELDKVLARHIAGAIVEFGCYVGTTSLFIRRLLDARKSSSSHPFHVYDSFAGLPPKGSQDISAAGIDFTAGKLRVGKKEFTRQFQSANLKLPVIHKGWFNNLDSQDIPQPIAFAFLDGDFYDSIITSLRLVWPRMAKGGVVVIDDYKRESLPGVERAICDFFRGKQPIALRSEQNKAIIEL